MPLRLARRQRDLAERHVALVRVIARTVARDLASRVELAELEAYGFDGLLRAAQRFNRKRGVAFATFAGYRIRGAMYDAARAIGAIPRAGAAVRATRQTTGLAAAVGLPSGDLGAEERAIAQETCRLLHHALAALSVRERQFLEHVYFEGKLLMDAGAALGLSKSAASRLHTRAVERLRKRLAALW